VVGYGVDGRGGTSGQEIGGMVGGEYREGMVRYGIGNVPRQWLQGARASLD